MHVKICQRCHVGLQIDTLQFGMYVLLARFLRFSSFKKKKKVCLASPETGVAILKKRNTSIRLTVLSLELNV